MKCIYNRSIVSVVCLLLSDIHIYHFLQGLFHFGLWRILQKEHNVTLTEASTNKLNINVSLNIYFLF